MSEKLLGNVRLSNPSTATPLFHYQILQYKVVYVIECTYVRELCEWPTLKGTQD